MAAQRLGAQRSPPALSTETPRLPQEAPDALLPLLHGEASQIRQASPRNEQPGSHQDPVQEIQGASREEKGTGWGWGGVGGGRLLVPLQLSQHNRHGSAPAWLRCHPALLQPRRTCWPCAASQGCGVGVEVEVTSVRPPLPDSAGRWRCRGVGRAGIAAALWRCRPAVLALGRAPRVGLSPAAKGPGCKVLRAARPRPAPRQGCPRDGAGGGDAFLPPGLGRRVWEQRRGCSPIGAVGPAQLAGSALPVPRADVPLCLLVVPR